MKKYLLYAFTVFALIFTFSYCSSYASYSGNQFIPSEPYKFFLLGSYTNGWGNTIYVYTINPPSDLFLLQNSSSTFSFYAKINGVDYEPVSLLTRSSSDYFDNNTGASDIYSYFSFSSGINTGGFVFSNITVPFGSSLPSPVVIDSGLASDVYLTHSEFKFLNGYLESFTVRGALNYSAFVQQYYIEIFVNGSTVLSYTYDFNLFDSWLFTRCYTNTALGAVTGDTIRVLAQPIGLNGNRGLKRGIEWVVGSGTSLPIDNLPYVEPKIDTPVGNSQPIAQPTKKIVISPQGDEITNNYYDQSYYINEPYDDSAIQEELNTIIDWLEKHENSGDSPQTIINNNYNNKYYNFNFDVDFDLSGNDINIGIGNAKKEVSNGFDSIITFIQPLMDSPFKFVVILLSSCFGLLLTVLVIVIIAKIIDIVLP